MAKKISIISKLPNAIKVDILEKVLIHHDSYDPTVLWLKEQHGINLSIAALFVFVSRWRNKFGGLMNLKMPIETIVRLQAHIEDKGIEQVEQEQIDELKKRGEYLFDYMGGQQEAKHESNP